MIRSKEELLESVHAVIGDTATDEAIALIEDITDTYDSMARPAEETDWEARYEENDAAWRAKYRDRFFNPAVEEPEADLEPAEEPDTKPKNYEDLFD